MALSLRKQIVGKGVEQEGGVMMLAGSEDKEEIAQVAHSVWGSLMRASSRAWDSLEMSQIGDKV